MSRWWLIRRSELQIRHLADGPISVVLHSRSVDAERPLLGPDLSFDIALGYGGMSHYSAFVSGSSRPTNDVLRPACERQVLWKPAFRSTSHAFR